MKSSTDNLYKYTNFSDNISIIRERLLADNKIKKKLSDLKYENNPKFTFTKCPSSNAKFVKNNKHQLPLTKKLIMTSTASSNNTNNTNNTYSNMRKDSSDRYKSASSSNFLKFKHDKLKYETQGKEISQFLTTDKSNTYLNILPSYTYKTSKKPVRTMSQSNIVVENKNFFEKLYNIRNRNHIQGFTGSFNVNTNYINMKRSESPKPRSLNNSIYSQKSIKEDNNKFSSRIDRVNSPLNKERLFKSYDFKSKAIGDRLRRVKPLLDLQIKKSKLQAHFLPNINY